MNHDSPDPEKPKFELHEVSLNNLSDIKVRFFKTNSERVKAFDILIVEFSETYRNGAAGNPDAVFMLAMVEAGKSAFECKGIVYDLSRVNYEWGDLLDSVFVGPTFKCGNRPKAVVVGNESREAVRTLFLGLGSIEPIEKIGWVFENVQSALIYVDSEIISEDYLDIHKKMNLTYNESGELQSIDASFDQELLDEPPTFDD
jgi:hypothetical protein